MGFDDKTEKEKTDLIKLLLECPRQYREKMSPLGIAFMVAVKVLAKDDPDLKARMRYKLLDLIDEMKAQTKSMETLSQTLEEKDG